MLDRSFQNKCFAILHIFPQRQPELTLLKIELTVVTRKCVNDITGTVALFVEIVTVCKL